MRSKLTPNTSVIKPKSIGIEIALRNITSFSLKHNNTIRKLR